MNLSQAGYDLITSFEGYAMWLHLFPDDRLTRAASEISSTPL